MRRLLAALICLLELGVCGFCAQPVDELLAKFASTKFDDIEAGISGLATSGSPQATADSRRIGRRQPADPAGPTPRLHQGCRTAACSDAATGEAAPADLVAASLKPVRVNNRIRRAIEAAVGSLTLMNPDPVRRLEAAAVGVPIARRRGTAGLGAGVRRRAGSEREAGAGRGARRYSPADAERRRLGSLGRRRDTSGARRPRVAGDPRRRAGDRPGQCARKPRRSPLRSSSDISASSPPPRTSSSASASARSCCWPRSASPSPSA